MHRLMTIFIIDNVLLEKYFVINILQAKIMQIAITENQALVMKVIDQTNSEQNHRKISNNKIKPITMFISIYYHSVPTAAAASIVLCVTEQFSVFTRCDDDSDMYVGDDQHNRNSLTLTCIRLDALDSAVPSCQSEYICIIT